MPVSSRPGWLTASPMEPSPLIRCTVTLLGSLYAVSRYPPDRSTLVWIGRDGKDCGSPCSCNAPEERIDAEGGGEVRGASEAGPAVARNDVEVSFRGMRPSILHVGRQSHRAAFFQRGACDVDLEQAQLRAGAGIKDRRCRHLLTHARSGTASGAATSALKVQRSIMSGLLRMGGLFLKPSVARMRDRRNHPARRAGIALKPFTGPLPPGQ